MIAAWALLLALAGPEPDVAVEAQPAPEAQRRGLVLVRVVPGGDSTQATLARLEAELGLVGFATARHELVGPALGPDLVDVFESSEAIAAVEIVIEGTRADLWIASRASGTTVHRRIDMDDPGGDARTLAIAAVELLDIGDPEPLPELRSEPQPPPIQVDELERPEFAEDETPAPERPPGARGAFSMVPMVSGSPGGFGPAAHVELAGRWAPSERFALRFAGWVPLNVNRVVEIQGSASLTQGMLFIEPQLRLPGGATWFHPELGLGLGVVLAGIRGRANDPYRSTSSLLIGFAGDLHLGLGFALAPRLWIRADGHLGVLLPQARITFEGEPVATWGLPFGAGSLGFEVWF